MVRESRRTIYAQIETWRNRPIEGEHPYLYLDGIVLKRSWAGEVRNVSLLVAVAVNADGYREILGIVEGAKEDKKGWSAFLKHLKERGLKGVEQIVSDACMGLVESAAEFYPDAQWQRCVVHWYRNAFSKVPAGKMREVALMLKAIHAQESRETARAKATEVAAKLRAMRLPKVADWLEETVEETLVYYAFPEEHWRRIRTTDAIDKRQCRPGLLRWAAHGRPRGEERARNWKARGVAYHSARSFVAPVHSLASGLFGPLGCQPLTKRS